VGPTGPTGPTGATGASTIAALTDVDLTGLSDGDVLVYDEDASKWVPGEGSGGASVTVSSTTPSSPNNGDLWFKSTDGNIYLFYEDIDSGQWVQLSGDEGPMGPTGPNGAQGATGPTGPDAFASFSPSVGDIVEYDGSAWVTGKRATTGKAIAMSIVFG
jgi:hypothetical protein